MHVRTCAIQKQSGTRHVLSHSATAALHYIVLQIPLLHMQGLILAQIQTRVRLQCERPQLTWIETRILTPLVWIGTRFRTGSELNQRVRTLA